jgi:hypothetical protein
MPSPDADAAGLRPVLMQMRQGWAQSRRRCGWGGPSPGEDVAGVNPVSVQMWEDPSEMWLPWRLHMHRPVTHRPQLVALRQLNQPRAEGQSPLVRCALFGCLCVRGCVDVRVSACAPGPARECVFACVRLFACVCACSGVPAGCGWGGSGYSQRDAARELVCTTDELDEDARVGSGAKLIARAHAHGVAAPMSEG